MRFIARAVCWLLALAPLAAAQPAHADRMALWTIVNQKCEPHFVKGDGPAPCESVDLSGGEDRGVAILKDLHGVAQMLAIPTRRVTGIEAPLLLAPDAPNYFAAAWAARTLLEGRLHAQLPREAVGVSINSMFSRSQDQFHLHVDCVDKDVAAALHDYQASLDGKWRVMTVALQGRHYWARRLDSADLADASPFRLLADDMPGAKTEMGLWSLAAIGATFEGKPGFILLADHAELTVGGHAENLQDHECAIAGAKP